MPKEGNDEYMPCEDNQNTVFQLGITCRGLLAINYYKVLLCIVRSAESVKPSGGITICADFLQAFT